MSFRTSNDTVIDQSISSDVRSENIFVTNQYLFALQASWSNGSTPSITVKLEASLDQENWVELSSPSITVSGTSGSDIIQLSEFAYKYLRVFVDHTSGSADLKVTFNAKGI